ncbi:aspartate 1-decarboxylase [Marinobacter halodurans]|uniref:Aspartate 1-decarboxylase n=1 Tax=Marinobacter halodurans TaxID=2528979 RepID=A0ABY1ZDY3_9GAMM|nr:aspartate 1-decarboxylase [Marinobacter halodurans]TBW47800.1 aspartate 1-decarboxylase [Marinobacter halodurans]
MYSRMLKAKIHAVKVTQVELDYEGSCGVDLDIMESAGVVPFEQVDVYNRNNGNRFTTYLIPAPRGSGTISLNGAAAHLCNAQDTVFLCVYASYTPDELASHRPVVVKVDEQNRVQEVKHEETVEAWT